MSSIWSIYSPISQCCELNWQLDASLVTRCLKFRCQCFSFVEIADLPQDWLTYKSSGCLMLVWEVTSECVGLVWLAKHLMVVQEVKLFWVWPKDRVWAVNLFCPSGRSTASSWMKLQLIEGKADYLKTVPISTSSWTSSWPSRSRWDGLQSRAPRLRRLPSRLRQPPQQPRWQASQ